MKKFTQNEIDMTMASFERLMTVKQQEVVRSVAYREEKQRLESLAMAFRKLRGYVEGCLHDLLDAGYPPVKEGSDEERDAIKDFAGDRSCDMFPDMNEEDREDIVGQCVTHFCGESS